MNTTTYFLTEIGDKSKNMVLDSIAAHYGVTRQEAYDIVTAPDAEHLLDYMVEPIRAGTSVLMHKHNCFYI